MQANVEKIGVLLFSNDHLSVDVGSLWLRKKAL